MSARNFIRFCRKALAVGKNMKKGFKTCLKCGAKNFMEFTQCYQCGGTEFQAQNVPVESGSGYLPYVPNKSDYDYDRGMSFDSNSSYDNRESFFKRQLADIKTEAVKSAQDAVAMNRITDKLSELESKLNRMQSAAYGYPDEYREHYASPMNPRSVPRPGAQSPRGDAADRAVHVKPTRVVQDGREEIVYNIPAQLAGTPIVLVGLDEEANGRAPRIQVQSGKATLETDYSKESLKEVLENIESTAAAHEAVARTTVVPPLASEIVRTDAVKDITVAEKKHKNSRRALVGWSIFLGILLLASLATLAANYLYDIAGWEIVALIGRIFKKDYINDFYTIEVTVGALSGAKLASLAGNLHWVVFGACMLTFLTALLMMFAPGKAKPLKVLLLFLVLCGDAFLVACVFLVFNVSKVWTEVDLGLWIKLGADFLILVGAITLMRKRKEEPEELTAQDVMVETVPSIQLDASLARVRDEIKKG